MESGPQTGPLPPAGVQIGGDLSRDFGQPNHIRRSAPPDHEGDKDDFWPGFGIAQPLGWARARSRNVILWSLMMGGSNIRRAEPRFSVGHVDSAHKA